VLDQNARVTHDVEVVDPDLEAEIEVLPAGDLVFLAPCADRARDVRAHHVHHTARRCRERSQHLHVGARHGAHGGRVARRGERGHDDARVLVYASGFEQ
jgi:hypothetical protein